MKITVVVPTYNEEKGLEKFLKQFKRQTLPRSEFELIIVDGNSSDRTREIAKKYADLVIIQKSKGVGGARNDGVKAARAEVVVTTDADVIFPPFWLEKIYNHFEKDLDLIFLFGSNYSITKNKVINFFSHIKRILNKVFTAFHIGYLAEGPNSAFRKSFFLRAGGYSDIPVMDDTEITSRMRKLGKIRYDNSIFVYSSVRRIDKNGISGSGFISITSYLKLILFGKESIQVNNYNKQEY
ncbi:MAG TPA: glycosyltransferase [Candidatus Deferrimicrobium sp.]|nr:glycosyltransferase [Candidatus Deferrimicrobium sp.]